MKLILQLIFLAVVCQSTAQYNPKEIDIRAFANSSIIGLGEESHGIKSINECRNQLVYDVSAKYNVKFIVWEESFADLYAVNKLLEDPDPNYDELLKRFTWFWQTEETKNLLKFIHEYNSENKEDKILILGMDYSPHLSSYQNIMEFFKDKIDDESILNQYSNFKDDFKSFKRLKKRQNKELIFIATRLKEELNSNAERYTAWYSNNEIELIKINIEGIIQAASYYGKNSDSRDLTMFKNVEAIFSLCEESEKLIIYAHNGHLQKRDDYDFEKVTGTYLKETYGKDYYAVGFEFGAGDYLCSYNTISTARMFFRYFVRGKSSSDFYKSRINNLELNPSSEVLNYFYNLKNDYLFIDLKRLNKETDVYKMLHENQLYHNIGGGCSSPEDSYIERNWSERFDGLFFIKHVEATNANF